MLSIKQLVLDIGASEPPPSARPLPAALPGWPTINDN